MNETPARPEEVPADWVLVLCQNECGDMVWVPPFTEDLSVQASMMLVCSAKCAIEMVDKL